MRTEFNPGQLRDPAMAQSEKILRACVHCGFCNATCPTYLQNGDENDGPRGRIYLMREMLQSAAVPDARTVAHIDSCLSCLGCATTCPSGVDYMRLVDHARAHIETHYRRPIMDRAFRAMLNFVLPHPARFALALRLGKLAAPFARMFPSKIAKMLAMATFVPPPLSPPNKGEGIEVGGETKIRRVALLAGCVQPTLTPETNAATIRLLNRLGVEVVTPETSVCCGALSHHLGKTAAAMQFARQNIKAWSSGGFDAIIITASGCGTQIKDYAHLLRDDPLYKEDAAHIASIARDIGEFLHEYDLPAPAHAQQLRIAWHAPCSLRHGQKQSGQVEALLRNVGFEVLIPKDAHLCCGAAGSYTLLQPEMSERLAAVKTQNLAALRPDIIASANVGCEIQIAAATKTPVLHWVQLLDWAYGGP